MNLKESYRYANYLDSLLDTVCKYLYNNGFVTITEQNHLRSKANPEAQDEVIVLQKPYDVNFTPNAVIDFAIKVINEKEKLFSAIADAKAKTEINIDNAISMNKKKQMFVNTLNNIVSIKSSETQSMEKDYKFDINIEQMPYFYQVLSITSIDFDRNSVIGLIKKYNKECDKISSKLDEIEIITQVDFKPLFDINDTFEDLVVD